MGFFEVLKIVRQLSGFKSVFLALATAAERFKAATADGKLTDDEVREVVSGFVEVVLEGKRLVLGADRR